MEKRQTERRRNVSREVGQKSVAEHRDTHLLAEKYWQFIFPDNRLCESNQPKSSIKGKN
jgi:hypothetical protein